MWPNKNFARFTVSKKLTRLFFKIDIIFFWFCVTWKVCYANNTLNINWQICIPPPSHTHTYAISLTNSCTSTHTHSLSPSQLQPHRHTHTRTYVTTISFQISMSNLALNDDRLNKFNKSCTTCNFPSFTYSSL